MSETAPPPVFQLQSPTLSGQLRLDRLGEISEAGPLGTDDGAFHSYGFSIQVEGLEPPLFAAGFARLEDAEDERRRLLDAAASPDPDRDYRVFDDLALRHVLGPIAHEAREAAAADGHTRYLVPEESSTFSVRTEAPEDFHVWYMVLPPRGPVRVEQKLDPEIARPLMERGIAEGAIVPVDSWDERRLRVEP
jgi:hypothetical protein